MVAPPEQRIAEGSDAKLPDPYEIVSILAVPAPTGTTGAGWYRYEIQQGTNKIVGYRTGCLGDVEPAIEAIVVGLNERRRHRRGRVQVVLQSAATKSRGQG